MAIYSYTIYDGHPSTGADAWTHRTDKTVKAADPTKAARLVRAILATEAKDLTEADGYSVGQCLYATIWHSDGKAVAEVSHELTEGDLDRKGAVRT